MDKMSLRWYDGFAVAGFFMLPTLFFTAPSVLVGESAGAAWISVLVAHLLVMLVFLILSAAVRAEPGGDLITVARRVLGGCLGRIFGGLLSVYFLVSTGLWVREGAEVFGVYGLSLTPVYIVGGLILAAAVAMNFFGGRATIKTVGIFILIIMFGVVAILLLGLNRYNPDYIFPSLGFGWGSIFSGGLYAAGIVEGVVVLALLAPDFSGTAIRRAGLGAIAVSAVLSSAFYLGFVMIFSPSVASGMTSGFMEMGKSIYYNRFFYRFESVLLFLLVFSSVLTAGLGLFFARRSAAITLGVERPRTLTIILALIIFAISCLPQSLGELTTVYLGLLRRHSIYFMAGMSVVILLAGKLRGVARRGR